MRIVSVATLRDRHIILTGYQLQITEAESSNKAEESALRQGEYDGCDHEYDDHDFDYESESMKDFTACDKECGNCDY